MNKKYKLIIQIVLLIAVGVVSRLLPHPWNMTPITALAITTAAYIGFPAAVGVMGVSMFISDIFLGFYAWPMMIAVYGSFFIAAAIGFFIRKNNVSIKRNIYGSLIASAIFYLVTNFAVWKFGTMYPQNASGLLASYIMALPFWRNALIGDIAYTFVLSLSYVLVIKPHYEAIKNPA